MRCWRRRQSFASLLHFTIQILSVLFLCCAPGHVNFIHSTVWKSTIQILMRITNTYLGNCREVSKTKNLWTKITQQEWVQSQTSDCHLHNEWQWLAAITPHWLHQIHIVKVEKHIIIWSKFWANNDTKNASWVSVAFLGATGRHGHDVG
jgi:hypothetical protein